MLPFEKSVVCPILIGRAAEIQTIADLRAQVQRGAGRVLLIAGEAGLGKTRHADDTASLAATAGTISLQPQVLRGYGATHASDAELATQSQRGPTRFADWLEQEVARGDGKQIDLSVELVSQYFEAELQLSGNLARTERILSDYLLAALAGLRAPYIHATAAPEAIPAVIAGAYLGGSSDDSIHAVTVDPTGIYVTGTTYSHDFPGAVARIGNTDLFVSKISPDGRALLWSVLLGGGDDESGQGIALDGQGGVWVTSFSESADFPTTANALQTDFGGFADAIVVQLDAASGSVRYGTYLGGAGFDQGAAIGTDRGGAIYMAGVADEDVLVMRMNIASYTPYYAGVIEASGADRATALAIADGCLFITGSTSGRGASNDYPLVNALQTECGLATENGSCDQDAFITVISPAGAIIYSTLLGGGYASSAISSGGDEGQAIALDSAGNILVAGITLSGDFPNLARRATGGLEEAPRVLHSAAPSGRSALPPYAHSERRTAAEAQAIWRACGAPSLPFGKGPR